MPPAWIIQPATVGMEVSDDADAEEHDIHPVARIQREVRVCLHPLDVALQHQHLYLRQYGAEHVRHRKPQIDLYVAAYPLRERALETVPYRQGEGYRTENRQHHEKEGADGVYHEGGGLEQQFEYLAEEVADALLHVVHPRSIYIPRHRHHVGGRPAEFLQLLVKLLVRPRGRRFRGCVPSPRIPVCPSASGIGSCPAFPPPASLPYPARRVRGCCLSCPAPQSGRT